MDNDCARELNSGVLGLEPPTLLSVAQHNGLWLWRERNKTLHDELLLVNNQPQDDKVTLGHIGHITPLHHGLFFL